MPDTFRVAEVVNQWMTAAQGCGHPCSPVVACGENNKFARLACAYAAANGSETFGSK
jgi:hypothetical protein